MSLSTRNRRLGPWDSLGPIIDSINELENTNVKCTWFQSIASGLSGTVTPPTGGTILLDEWSAGIDALVSKIDTGVPTFEPVLDDEGVIITATLDAAGAYTISGTPGDGYPVSIIYVYRVTLDAFDYAYCLNTAQVEGVNTLSLLGGLANELTGFPENYRDESVVSFDDGTRTLTLDPVGDKYSVWVLGKEFVYFAVAASESVIIPDTEGIHWIYFDEDGAMQVVTNPAEGAEETLIKKNAIVAYVLWDATNKVSTIFADERHQLTMDGATHFYLHEIAGYAYYEGLQAGDITADGDGSTDAAATMSLTQGTLFDEDLKYETLNSGQTLSTPAQIPVYYIDGVAGTWRKDTADSFPVKNFVGGSSLLAYNSFSTPNWGQTEIANGRFVLAHIFATNDIDEPIIAIQGQDDYNNLGDARTGADTELLNLKTVGLPAQEFTPLYTLIYQTSTTYSNTVKARIRTNEAGDDYIDWRATSVGASSGGGGAGDVTGPGASTDNAIATWDGATGTVLQDTTVTLDAGIISGLSAPVSNGDAIRQTTSVTEVNLNALTDTSVTALHFHNSLKDGAVVGAVTAAAGATELNHAGVKAFATGSSGVNIYKAANRLYIAEVSSGWEINSQTNGYAVSIKGLNAAAAEKTIFVGDPDGAAEHYFAGTVSLKTTKDGISVHDTDSTGPQVDFYGNGAEHLGQIQTTVTLMNFFIGSGLETGMTIAKDGAVTLYYNNAAKVMTTVLGATFTREFLPGSLADHTAEGDVVTATVDSNATGIGAALYMAADAHFDEADADSVTTMQCRALATETGTGSKVVLLKGYMRDDTWTWTPGGDIFVSGTAGGLTQTAPSGTGDQVQIVGFAWSAAIIYFSPGDYSTVEIT